MISRLIPKMKVALNQP